METKQDMQDYLRKTYQAAIGAGLLRTVKEFAEALEVDPSGLSSAMNGRERNLTPSLIKKVRRWAETVGLEGEKKTQPEGEKEQKGVFIPEETLALYTNLSETCRNLSAIVAQMQVGVPQMYGTVFAPKNSRTEK